MKWCGHLVAIHAVATNEHTKSTATDAVIRHVCEMHAKVSGMCSSYDKLRSLVGALEMEQGVASPRFYVDAGAGDVCKCHCPELTSPL